MVRASEHEMSHERAGGHSPDGVRVTSIEVRRAGVLGVIAVPPDRVPDFGRDLVALAVRAEGSDGSGYQGYTTDVDASDRGLAISFVLTPRPTPESTFLRLSLPATPLDARSGGIELVALLGC